MFASIANGGTGRALIRSSTNPPLFGTSESSCLRHMRASRRASQPTSLWPAGHLQDIGLMAVVEDFHRDFLPRFIDAQHAFHDGDPAPNNALWTDSDPVTLFARVVGPFVRCCGWGAGGQEAAMGALCGARFSWAPKYARL